jgi:GTP-binding protein
LGAKGGRGGRGNFHFRGPKNTSPKQSEKGKPGEKFNIRLELKLIADVGLIGLPNAGKSSLLNELTRANAKVANYPFTTLEPNLGSYYGLIIADIPGLIEGASGGKGLGVKFLRHIERTRVIFHLISSESEDPTADYGTVRKELKAHNSRLLDKPEYVFLSKSDILSEKDIEKKIKELAKTKKEVVPLSIIDEESIGKIRTILNKIARERDPGAWSIDIPLPGE